MIVRTEVAVFIGCLYKLIYILDLIFTRSVRADLFKRCFDLGFLDVLAVILTFLFAGIVNFAMYFRLQKISMTESLKSIE